MQEQYRKFQNSIRADVKLKIALEQYAVLDAEKNYGIEWQAYRKYLEQRKRAAWEVLIREENLEGFRLFEREGWIRPEDAKECLLLASRWQKKESQLWLLKLQWKTEETKKIFSRENLCENTLKFLEEEVQNQIPAVGSALPLLKWKEKTKEGFLWGTDGEFLYYQREEVLRNFQKGSHKLERKYLHSLFHCLYLHMLSEEPLEKDCWNLACDVAVEWAIDESGWFPLELERKKTRRQYYTEIFGTQGKRDTKTCYEYLLNMDKNSRIQLQEEFFQDDHKYWYKKKQNIQEKLWKQEHLLQQWGLARKSFSLQQEGERYKAGVRGGIGKENYQLKKRKAYDYRKFLQRFAVCREEMQLDMESIDYIPYLYGLERYGNMLLVEPLETTEVNRLEEFVIAIDTSGSCSGEIVRRFLEETYQILSERENFFRKMNVHIIQCDSMIQDHQKITCEEDWKHYQENIQIQGLGGTNFTPVFQLVDQMLEKKEIQNLKGLMYFTDGDGIFPSKKPAYETAFVFLNRELEKGRIPDWGIPLYLDVKL